MEGAKLKKLLDYIIAACLFILLTTAAISWAISINATGQCDFAIGSSDLQAGPGSDLNPSYSSASDQVILDIIAAGNWGVDVNKSDSKWHSNFHLSIKRTSDGTGSGTISGGSDYQEITGTNQSFFSGSLDRNTINIQLQLTGVSITIPPDNYSTTVTYTVADQ